MSKGPGNIEQRIADLFAATRDRALSINDIVDNAYGLAGQKPSRAQRLSATRAAHRVLKRVRAMHAKADELVRQAHENTRTALGRDQLRLKDSQVDEEYHARFDTDPVALKSRKLREKVQRIGVWARFVRVDSDPNRLRAECDFWSAITLKGRSA